MAKETANDVFAKWSKTVKQSSMERACAKCNYRTANGACMHLDVCHAAFVRGYIKGYKYGKQESK